MAGDRWTNNPLSPNKAGWHSAISSFLDGGGPEILVE